MTTKDLPESWLTGAGSLDAASLSLIRRFFLLLYQCFFFGCDSVASAATGSACCSGKAPPPLPPAACAAMNGAFSTIAVCDRVRTCAGGIAPGGKPFAADAIDGVGGGESWTTDGVDFANEPGPLLRSDGKVVVDPDAMA